MLWRIALEQGTGFWIALLAMCNFVACSSGRSPTEDVPLEPVEVIEDNARTADSDRQADVDAVSDVGSADEGASDVHPVDTSDVNAAWQKFGEGHMLLAVNSNSVNHIQGTTVQPEEWASELEVVLHTAEASPEVLFDVSVYEGPEYGISHPFTHVVAVALDDEEDVEICISLYAPGEQLRLTVCRETTIRPGTTGQVLWQLSTGECSSVYDQACPSPRAESLASLPADASVPPVLSFDVILAHETGSVVIDPSTVSFSVYPPMPCDNARQLYDEEIAGIGHDSSVSCIEPPAPNYIAGTELTVQLTSSEEAIGLVHHVLNMPNGYPARTLWDEMSAAPITETLVGVSYDEIGTGKAEKPCEWWTCP